MKSKWMAWETKKGPVEIKVEQVSDGALPNKLYIRRDKEKYVTVPCTADFFIKYYDITEAIESESRILFE